MENLGISAGTAGTILLAAAVSDFYVSQTCEDWISTYQPLEDLLNFISEDLTLDSKMHWFRIEEPSTSVFGTRFSTAFILSNMLLHP